jgi:co-chaperonin GroES (HSP10)
MMLTLNRLLIEEEETIEKIGSILLTDQALHRQAIGTVVEAGTGYYTTSGAWIDNHINVGDRVLYAKGTGDIMTLNGRKLTLLTEHQVFAVLEPTDKLG